MRTFMRSAAAALLTLLASPFAVAQTVVATASPTTPVAAPDPDNLVIAQQIIEIAFPKESRMQLLEGMMNAVSTQFRPTVNETNDPGLQAIQDRYFARMMAKTKVDLEGSSPGMFAAIARAYARTFTKDELTQIKAFVDTPAGARFIQRSPQTLSDPDVAAWNSAYFTRTMARLQSEAAGLKSEITEYMRKKHAK
jgi:hypothetical protein